jgi:hypothetical protein
MAILVGMENQLSVLFRKIGCLKRHLDGRSYFAEKNMQVIADWNRLTVQQLEQFVFCVATTYFRGLAIRGKGTGKGKVHPRTCHEVPEGVEV